jgi:hypothetical protein
MAAHHMTLPALVFENDKAAEQYRMLATGKLLDLWRLYVIIKTTVRKGAANVCVLCLVMRKPYLHLILKHKQFRSFNQGVRPVNIKLFLHIYFGS